MTPTVPSRSASTWVWLESKVTSFSLPETLRLWAAWMEPIDRLAACPLLRRWTDLETLACPGQSVYERLLGSPHLTNLRRLVVCSNEIAGPQRLPSLRPTAKLWSDVKPTKLRDEIIAARAM